MSFRLERGDVQAEWLGALHLTHRGRGVLLGAPAGIAESLGPAVDTLDAVVLLTGQLRTLEGLLGLLAARTVPQPMEMVSFVGEPRAMALVDAFGRGWSECAQPVVDVVQPGQSLVVGEARLSTRAARCGEARGSVVASVAGGGARVSLGGLDVAYLPGVAPSSGWRAFVGSAHLAVVEVGVLPWPRTEGPWRHDLSAAIRVGAGADRLWLVGDDGQPLEAAQA
ncbi:MAG: hypothetical protein ACI8PZ_000106 [Myxococcota bacterium]